MSSGKKHIIIDIGSGFTKAGFEGEEDPCYISRSLMYKYRNNTGMFMDEGNFSFGSDIKDSEISKSESPLSKNGIIQQWESFEMYLRNVFHKLNIDEEQISNHSILLPERPLSPKNQRERIAQLLFEKFEVNQMYVINSAILGLYASGRVNGVVLDVGEKISHIVPLVEGFPKPSTSEIFELGGYHVTNALRDHLIEKVNLPSRFANNIRFLENMKEKLGFVKLTNEGLDKVIRHKLPDGNSISLTNEMRSHCGEVLFNPNAINNEIEMNGIQNILYNTIKRTDGYLRPRLYGSIILAGGGTMMDHFPQRLNNELRMLIPNDIHYEIVAQKQRKYSVWNGGSILSSIRQFDQMWVKREEYNDWGPQAMARKYI